MSFTPNIPSSGQSLGNSRTQVRDNFSSLRTSLATNHYDVNDANSGKHQYVVMPAQGSDPALTGTDAALYCKISDGNNWFFKRGSDTAVKMTANWTPVVGTSGSTFLPGGIIMQWGIKSCVGGPNSVSFATAFTNLYNIQLTVLSTTQSRTAIVSNGTPPTTSGFSIAASGTCDVYWMAIGNKA